MHGREPAAAVIRLAAAATALSWLSTLSTTVSSSTASAKVPSTTSTGEPGKNASPSAYPHTDPLNLKCRNQSSVTRSTTPARSRCARSDWSKRNASIASSNRPVPATTPYRRPGGSRRAKTSNTHRRSAAPLRSAACSMVSS